MCSRVEKYDTYILSILFANATGGYEKNINKINIVVKYLTTLIILSSKYRTHQLWILECLASSSKNKGWW